MEGSGATGIGSKSYEKKFGRIKVPEALKIAQEQVKEAPKEQVTSTEDKMDYVG